MIHPEFYVNFNYEQKIILASIIIMITIICVIVAKMKNKTIKRKRRQAIRQTINFDVYDFILHDLSQEFIGQRKVYKNEIRRL